MIPHLLAVCFGVFFLNGAVQDSDPPLLPLPWSVALAASNSVRRHYAYHCARRYAYHLQVTPNVNYVNNKRINKQTVNLEIIENAEMHIEVLDRATQKGIKVPKTNKVITI